MQFEHFSIRLLNEEDTEAFFALIDRNRPRLEAFFSGTVARTRTLEDTKAYVVEVMDRIRQKTYLPHLLINEEDKSFAGFMDIKNIDWNIPRGELGSFIDENWANKKILTKALKLFIGHCFEQHGFNKLFLRTHESNHAARKVAEHCGFELEGKLRWDYRTTSGELTDMLYYGKIKP